MLGLSYIFSNAASKHAAAWRRRDLNPGPPGKKGRLYYLCYLAHCFKGWLMRFKEHASYVKKPRQFFKEERGKRINNSSSNNINLIVHTFLSHKCPSKRERESERESKKSSGQFPFSMFPLYKYSFFFRPLLLDLKRDPKIGSNMYKTCS